MAESGWRVTDQVTDQVQNTRAGAVVVGVQVYFQTGEGNEGSVFLANQHYNAKNVHKAISAQAKLIDEVGRLEQGTLQPGLQ
jgi:hypothetical protein